MSSTIISNDSAPRRQEITRWTSNYDGLKIDHYDRSENNMYGVATGHPSNELTQRYHWVPAALKWFYVKFSRGVLDWSDVRVIMKNKEMSSRHFNTLTFKSETADVYRSSDVMRTVMFVSKHRENESPGLTGVCMRIAVQEFVTDARERTEALAARSPSSWFQSAFYSSGRFGAVNGDKRTARFFATITAPTTALTDGEIDEIKSQTADWYDVIVLPHDKCFAVTEPGVIDDPRNASVVWHGLAHLRAPRLHSEIVDMVMIWSDIPPYIILEIIDWLPEASVMAHKKKIDLIYAVKTSIRKLTKKDE